MKRSMNDLRYWYPKVKDIVPTPKTEIVEADGIEFVRLMDGEIPAGYKEFLGRLGAAIGRLGGMPCFIRTGHTSGKHDWEDTCFLQDIQNLSSHVRRLVEFSFIADLFGLPDDTWVARELLPTKPQFKAFWGNMPITRELRLFVDDGKIVHRQPYWPVAAIEGHCSEPGWKEKMYEIQRFNDVDEMRELERMTMEINKAVTGYWSVDWLDTERGWYMIDMAIGKTSYKWEPGKEP